MKITEEVDRRRQNLKIEDSDRGYSELKDLLENRISLDDVHEEKYFNDIEKGQIRARIEAVEGMDRFTTVEVELFVTIDKSVPEMDIQAKVKLVTDYPTSKPWQGTLWYYAYRSIYDKFLYGSVREGFEEPAEEKLDKIMMRVRDTLEVNHG